MFDNHNNPTGAGAPPNLPVGEPDDMFAGANPTGNEFTAAPLEAMVPAPGIPAESMSVAPPAPTALEAGVLRPRAVSGMERPEMPERAPFASPLVSENMPAGSATSGVRFNDAPVMTRPPEGVLREPMGGRTVWFTVLTLVSLAIVGGGGAWVYFTYINPRTVPLGTVNTTTTTTAPIVVPINTNVGLPTDSNSESPTSTDQQILFGDPVLDTDSDGLDDSVEKKLGTDMLLWDTDSDTLSDGDEVLTWKTDPKKSDTDGDTFADGVEIRNGYNPRGDGKLFPVNPATSTPATALTTTTAAASSSSTSSTVK